MSPRTRAALLLAAVLTYLGGLFAPAATAASPLCDSACILQQLQSHSIPAPTGDGVRQYNSDRSLVYYTGQNGLEIRLSHDKTAKAIKTSSNIFILGASWAIGGEALDVGGAIEVALIPDSLKNAARVAFTLGGIDLTDIAVKAVQLTHPHPLPQ